jgi:hypothetical protein
MDRSWSSSETLNWNRQGEKASVTLKVRLFMVIGEVRQVERYTLKNVEGHWLIDGQAIQEERVIGRTI